MQSAVSFHVRTATIDDAPAVARVHTESWRSTYAHLLPEEFLRNLSVEARTLQWQAAADRTDTAPFLVAEDAAGIFGFVNGGPARDIPGFAGELYAIYLLRDRQGSGAGRALVSGLAREMRVRGFRDLALWVLRDNPSRGFYEHLGGTRVMEKDIMIGGVTLAEVALGWPDVSVLGARA